nr:tyrosine-type recombinase/integrase [Anaerolineae bacterium]
WLLHLETQGKSPHTVQAYQRALEHFVAWNQAAVGEEFRPADIIPRDVRDWQSYQRRMEQAAPSTINQRLVALSRYFTWAVGCDLAPADPTADISSIKLTTRQPKGLSKSNVRRLLRAVHSNRQLRDIALIEVLLGTGIRVGELLALQVGDVNLKERSGSLIVREGKHGSFREIPLTQEVRTALKLYLAAHPDQNDPLQPLWMGIHGSLRHRSAILRILTKYADQAGIDQPVSPHRLRHTFATRYLAANPDDLRGLAALLGHSSLDTVMIYTGPTLDDLALRMKRFELNVDTAEEGSE